MPFQPGLVRKPSSFPTKASKQRINSNQTREERVNNTARYRHKKLPVSEIRIRFEEKYIIYSILYKEDAQHYFPVKKGKRQEAKGNSQA